MAPCVGESPELKGYFICACLNSIGDLSGGGLGQIMAHWVANGTPNVDVTGMNVNPAVGSIVYVCVLLQLYLPYFYLY
jgi:4-methylaminobutanoate oxidase (formaldehyde-forming)